MALASEDRRKIWSARTVVELREKSLIYNLLDHSWERDWVNGAASVAIPIPNLSGGTTGEGVATEDRARGGNWAAARRPDQAVVMLTRKGSKAASNKIDWEDAIELPWPVVDRYRSSQSYFIAHDIDTAIYDAIVALPSGTITAGAGDTHRVQKTFPYAADIPAGRDHPLYDAINMLALNMVRLNAIDGEGSPTGSVSGAFLVAQPEMVMSFRSWMLRQKLSFDPLTREILRENPGLAGQGYIGNVSGIKLYQWNHLTVPSGVNWSCYGGVSEAVAVGIRPPLSQYWDPENNQSEDNPSHLIRQTSEFAWVETLDQLHFKINVRAGS